MLSVINVMLLKSFNILINVTFYHFTETFLKTYKKLNIRDSLGLLNKYDGNANENAKTPDSAQTHHSVLNMRFLTCQLFQNLLIFC